jgi:hypothetical protein
MTQFRFKSKQAKQAFISQTAYTLSKRIWDTQQKWSVDTWTWNALEQAETIGTKVIGNIETIHTPYLETLTEAVRQSTNNRLHQLVLDHNAKG